MTAFETYGLNPSGNPFDLGVMASYTHLFIMDLHRVSRILCVGTDIDLPETRCAVLRRSGYSAKLAMPAMAAEELRTSRFDLVILSAMLSEEQKQNVYAKTPHGTKVLALDKLVLPNELLKLILKSVP